jgi:hypothetical protein
MANETRVKEYLNLIYHGLKFSQRAALFREVREWLGVMDLDSVLVKARIDDPVGVKLAEQRFDMSLSDFNPDRMVERMRIERELREEAAQVNPDGSDDIT